MSRSTPVASLMSTDLVTFAPEDNVQDAMQALVDADVDGAPVVDADGQVVGVISTGDLIVQQTQLHFPTVISFLGAAIELPSAKRTFDEDIRRALGASVGEVMSTDPVTVDADATVEEAATLMHQRKVARLPVLRDGALVGIIARTDILRGIMAEESSAPAAGTVAGSDD